jgi:hypothetical protein
MRSFDFRVQGTQVGPAAGQEIAPVLGQALGRLRRGVAAACDVAVRDGHAAPWENGARRQLQVFEML